MSSDLTGKQVLIWGLGRHGGGLAAARFCARRGAQVRILDGKPLTALGADGAAAIAAAWPASCGDSSHPWLGEVDLIVASPAIPPRAWPQRCAPRTTPEILAFSEHRGRRVAVTGTKGKSTTAHILGSLLQWPVVGNSNEPVAAAIDRLGPEADLVCELSSFQLHYLADLRPRFTAVIMTSLATDHLDWHGSVEAYHRDKCALLAWTDRCVISPGLPFPGMPRVDFDTQNFIGTDGHCLAARSDLHLLGEHNAANAALALTVALALGIDAAALAPRLRTVCALPHRLRTVHRGRLTWVDDSIATTPESAMAALAAIPGPLGIILGGADKGARWEALAQAIQARGAVPVTIGSTGPALAAALGDASRFHRDLATALPVLTTALPDGATVLLSPACSSLDQFTSFEERGRRFLDLAKTLDP